MAIDQLLSSITPEAYENLKYAAETGRWPNGEKLSQEQRDYCLQAIIAYDLKHNREEDRVGFIDRSKKEKRSSTTDTSNEWQTLRINDAKSDV